MDCQATWSVSVTQCDPIAASKSLASPAEVSGAVVCPAKRLGPRQRQDLAVQVLDGAKRVSNLARRHEVRRKFLYQKSHAAQEALSNAFTPSSQADDVHFYLPVTKAWLRQLVLALVLTCHSSHCGVLELLRGFFNYRISAGSVHNVVRGAVCEARRINKKYNLSSILVGAHDKGLQATDPILVGVNTTSNWTLTVRKASPIPSVQVCL